MTEETNKIVEKPYTDPITGKFKEGNPGGGRPKGAGISITTEIKRKLEEYPEGKDKTYLHYLIEKIMKKAVIDEDQQTIKQIWNYIDGLPVQNIDQQIKKMSVSLEIKADFKSQKLIDEYEEKLRESIRSPKNEALQGDLSP